MILEAVSLTIVEVFQQIAILIVQQLRIVKAVLDFFEGPLVLPHCHLNSIVIFQDEIVHLHLPLHQIFQTQFLVVAESQSRILAIELGLADQVCVFKAILFLNLLLCSDKFPLVPLTLSY